MMDDLRLLVQAEERYFASNARYTTDLGPSGLAFRVNDGNDLPQVRLTPAGFVATMRHSDTPRVCTVFVGWTPDQLREAEGQPRCF